MKELLKIILSISLSGALLILALLLVRPLVRHRLSKRWQYYIWLVAVARLLLPLTPEASLMGMVFQQLDPPSVQAGDAPAVYPETDFTAPQVDSSQPDGDGWALLEPEHLPAPSVLVLAKQNISLICLLLWLIVAIGLLIRKITVYQGFVKYIKAGQTAVSDLALWEKTGQLMERYGIKGPVGLYTNSLVSSPLLIGFLRPSIILPTAALAEADFDNTILHELTHYKRRDMFYKWLVQLTICLHWFNPLVHLMGREVNRACELSCDEAVIKSLDAEGRRAYGDTLLNAMGAGGSYQDAIASVTLHEGKERLKERLDAIMMFKKTTRLTAAVSILLIGILCFGAAAAGAYTISLPEAGTQARLSVKTEPDTKPHAISKGGNTSEASPAPRHLVQVPVDIKTAKNGVFLWLGEFTLSYGDKIHYNVSAEKGNLLETGFAALGDDPVNRTYFTISNRRENGALANRGDFTVEPPAKPGQYRLYLRAADGDLSNVTGSISIETAQAPALPFASPGTDHVKTDFTGITVTGKGPVGLELVRSRSPEVRFELLSMDSDRRCTAKAEVVDGVMQITVDNYAPNGLTVNFSPPYQNVVRVTIPDAVYTKFDIQATEMVVKMQDFHAPVHAETSRAGFWLIDETIAQGTYDIKVSDGPIHIEAGAILKDITANADRGKVSLRFLKAPENLYLDSTGCTSMVERPDDWPAIYKVGSRTPKITVINRQGKAVIEVGVPDTGS